MLEKSKKIARGAAESLKLLWGNNFFKNWQSFPQTIERLARDDYHFSSSELGMALKRAKFLTRRGKRGNFEYIQKYPFAEDYEKQEK